MDVQYLQMLWAPGPVHIVFAETDVQSSVLHVLHNMKYIYIISYPALKLEV